jgi:hypothetical protein
VILVRTPPSLQPRGDARAAHEINRPTFTHAILMTDELIAALDQVMRTDDWSYGLT